MRHNDCGNEKTAKDGTRPDLEAMMSHFDKTAGRPFELWLKSSQDMKRELKPAEREEVVAAIAAGDRVKATSIYLSATEGNLTEAQNFIKSLTLERVAALKAEEKAS